ncbi:hypothetical protein ACRWZ5_26605, partial [Escherichia coli]
SHRQKQKKLIMLPSETMIWQPEFTDKTLSRKPVAVQCFKRKLARQERGYRQRQLCAYTLWVISITILLPLTGLSTRVDLFICNKTQYLHE